MGDTNAEGLLRQGSTRQHRIGCARWGRSYRRSGAGWRSQQRGFSAGADQVDLRVTGGLPPAAAGPCPLAPMSLPNRPSMWSAGASTARAGTQAASRRRSIAANAAARRPASLGAAA